MHFGRRRLSAQLVHQLAPILPDMHQSLVGSQELCHSKTDIRRNDSVLSALPGVIHAVQDLRTSLYELGYSTLPAVGEAPAGGGGRQAFAYSQVPSPQMPSGLRTGELAPLDFTKLRADIARLAHEADSEFNRLVREGQPTEVRGHEPAGPVARGLCLLLQSLRTRLALSTPGVTRSRTLHAYIQNDLFDLRASKGSASLSALLTSSVAGVRHAASRFVNTLSSAGPGRTYLLQKQSLIRTIFTVMTKEASDTATRQNLLGALQKLSLRRQPQDYMIELGVVEWIIHLLREHSQGTRR